MKVAKLAVLTGLLAALPGLSPAQTVLSVRTLSFAAAHEAATVALETCQKSGYAVTRDRTGPARADQGRAP